MRLSVSHQGWVLLLSLIMGAGMGFVYDVLRPPRRHSGAAMATLLDGFFAVAAAVTAFFFAMSSGDGRLGTWELAAVLLGFLLYMHRFSPILLPFVEKVFRACGILHMRVKKIVKKVQNKLKKLFPKIQECFKIRG